MLELFIARKAGHRIIAAPIVCHDEGSHIRLVKPYAGVTTFEVRNIGTARAIAIANTEQQAKQLVMTYYEKQVKQLKNSHAEYVQEWMGLEEFITRLNRKKYRHIAINDIVFDHHKAVQVLVAPSASERHNNSVFIATGLTNKEACEEIIRQMKEAKLW